MRYQSAVIQHHLSIGDNEYIPYIIAFIQPLASRREQHAQPRSRKRLQICVGRNWEMSGTWFRRGILRRGTKTGDDFIVEERLGVSPMMIRGVVWWGNERSGHDGVPKGTFRLSVGRRLLFDTP